MEENKICGKCGASLPEGAKFCVRCGAAVEEKEEYIICPRCSSQMEPGLFFCTRCGERLREGAAPSFLNKPEDGAQSPADAPAAPVNYALPAAPDDLPQTTPVQQNAAAPRPEVETPAASAQAVPVQKKKSPTVMIALSLFAAAALAGAAVFITGGLGSADTHYKKACDAMEQIGMMNWNPEMSRVPKNGDDYTDEDFYKQWLIVKKELKKAADKGTPDMKCDYVAFLMSHVLGEPDDFMPEDGEVEKYLRAAEAEGSSRAKYYLAERPGILKNEDEKISLLKEANTAGNPYSLYKSAQIITETTKNYEVVLTTLALAVTNLETNDPENTPFMNEMKAVWPRSGSSPAAEWPAEIGAMCELGVTGMPNLPEALRWYEKSASITNSLHTSNFFICFASGVTDGYMVFDPNDAVARVKRKMGRR